MARLPVTKIGRSAWQLAPVSRGGWCSRVKPPLVGGGIGPETQSAPAPHRGAPYPSALPRTPSPSPADPRTAPAPALPPPSARAHNSPMTRTSRVDRAHRCFCQPKRGPLDDRKGNHLGHGLKGLTNEKGFSRTLREAERDILTTDLLSVRNPASRPRIQRFSRSIEDGGSFFTQSAGEPLLVYQKQSP